MDDSTVAAAGKPFRHIFVQMRCEIGRTYEVAAQIIDTVETCGELFSTSGDFDLIGRFDVSRDDPGLFVTETLHRIKGIAATRTIIAFNAFTPGAR